MKKLLLYLSILLLIFGVGCNTNLSKDSSNKTSVTPYATEEELNALLESHENVVDYRVARTLGLIEMQNFLTSCNWSSSVTLSATPVVIYSPYDTPEYYEFHVIDNGEDVGYVTCIADKTLGDPIQYISRDRKVYNIDAVTKKSLGKNTSRIYNYGYPNVGVLSTSEVKSKSYFKSQSELESDMLDEWVNSFTDEELVELGVNRDDIKTSYYQNQAEEKERLDNLWNLIDAAKEDIVNTSDDMIINVDGITSKSATWYETDVFVLDEWCNPKDVSLSYIGGACGSTALLQAMKGFFTKYGYQTFGVNDYYEMLKRCDAIWNPTTTTATTYSGLKKGLEKMTGDKLTLTYGWYCFWGGINFNHINKELRTNKLPILSLRGFRTAWVGDWGKDQWHYRNIIGTAERKYKEDKRFLWWTWTAYWSDKYYLMTDNGADANNSTKVGIVENSSFDSEMNKYDDHDGSRYKFWETSSCGQLSHYPYRFK